RWQSYAVISLETPKPDALRKKSENQRRDFGLKRVAHGYPRRRARLIDKFANATRNQIGFRRILHVAFHFVPSFGDFCFISLVGQLALDHCIRSEEHTSELQSRGHLVCRLLLEKKKKNKKKKKNNYNKKKT